MKENFKEFVFVIDRSEAFANVAENVVAGINAIVDAQKKSEDNEAAYTLAFFNDSVKISADGKSMADMRKYNSVTYAPKGGCAMYNALSAVVDAVGARLSNTAEEERPDKVTVFVISSADNASAFVSASEAAEKVAVQHYTYKWDFRYYGLGGEAVGITEGISGNINKTNIDKAFKQINKTITALRK